MPLGFIRAPPWGRHQKNIKKNLLLQNHKAQSFHIFYVAMCSGPLHKSCQPCPMGFKMALPQGVISSHRQTMEKTKKIFFSETTRPRALAMYSGPLYKSCQLCPWSPYVPRPAGVMGKNIKKSSTPKPQGPESRTKTKRLLEECTYRGCLA